MSRHRLPPGARARVPVAVALLGALGLLGGLGSYAYWNDEVVVAGSTITSGTLDLKVEGVDSYTWSALSTTGLAPGESVAKSLTFSNAGSTPFTVSITSSVSTSLEAFRTAVLATVTDGTATTGSATYPRSASCSGVATYGPAALPLASTAVLGPTTAIQPGESRTFCVRLLFSVAAGNTTQSKTLSPTFTVTATQVSP